MTAFFLQHASANAGAANARESAKVHVRAHWLLSFWIPVPAQSAHLIEWSLTKLYKFSTALTMNANYLNYTWNWIQIVECRLWFQLSGICMCVELNGCRHQLNYIGMGKKARIWWCRFLNTAAAGTFDMNIRHCQVQGWINLSYNMRMCSGVQQRSLSLTICDYWRYQCHLSWLREIFIKELSFSLYLRRKCSLFRFSSIKIVLFTKYRRKNVFLFASLSLEFPNMFSRCV